MQGIPSFLTVADAARIAGCCTATVRRRIARAGVPLIADPIDRRRRLLRGEDLRLIIEPGAAAAWKEAA